MTVFPSPAADYGRVSGGGHCGPYAEEAAQEVQEDQTEAQGTQEAMALSAEHPTHSCNHHSGGVCGGSDHMVAVVGLYL